VNPVSIVSRRLEGTSGIDDWGFDRELRDLVAPLADLRWSVTTGGSTWEPEGPALVVANGTGGVLAEPVVVMQAVRSRWQRTARVVGMIDVAPIGPVQRRLGAILSRPDEVRGVLRDGHVVAMVTSSRWRPGRVGGPSRDLLAVAAELDVPVVPLTLRGRPFGRRYLAMFGEPTEARSAGPLAVAELADGVRAQLQEQLDDLDPPRWFW
jgi:hypothetical protein